MTPVRLAHGEPERMLDFLKAAHGLPAQTSEEELMAHLKEVGERELPLPPLPPLPGWRELMMREAEGWAESIMHWPALHVQGGKNGERLELPEAEDMNLDRLELIQVPQRVEEDLEREQELQTPPPAPATPVTPSNADEAHTPTHVRKRLDKDGTPLCTSHARAAAADTTCRGKCSQHARLTAQL